MKLKQQEKVEGSAVFFFFFFLLKAEKRKEELETFLWYVKAFYNDASDQLFPGVLENKKRGKQLDLKER